MKNGIIQFIRRNFRSSRLFWLFALEGALLQYSTSINGFANNIFATNLGASDLQIGLIQTIPNLAAVLIMLPLAVWADRASSSRTVPIIMLLCITAGYLLLGSVPLLKDVRIPVFFLALPFTVGGPTLYGVHWQNLFGDVTPEEERYKVLGMRNRFMSLVGIAAPLLCGMLMNRYVDTEHKIRVLQVFFYSCALVTLLQAFTIARVPVPMRGSAREDGFSLREFGNTINALMHNRAFMMFFVPAVFFYVGWQLDWSMWYIEEIDYLHMTEAQLSIYSAAYCIGQLVYITILTRTVHRRSPDFVLILVILALALCPPIISFCMILPDAAKVPSFILMIAVLTTAQTAVNMCTVLILLRVSPEDKRTMAMSLFTLTTTLMNIFMPYLGIQLYEALGSNFRAALLFNLCTFVMRGFAVVLFLWRYRYLRRRGDIEERRAA